MKNTMPLAPWITAAAFLLAGCVAQPAVEPVVPQDTPPAASATPDPASDLPSAVGKLHWFGTSAILYHGSKNIYFDPVTLDGDLPPADIVFISHAHSDHAELESLKKIIVPGTVLIVSENVRSFCNDNAHEIGVVATIMKEGESAAFGDIKVEAVPAYDDVFHIRSTEGAGFVVTIDGQRIYFAGGTRVHPEMAEIVSDVAIYPWYKNADVLAAADILKTKALILVHAGYTGVKAFADVYGREITRLKIVALEPGPYNP